MPGAPGGSDPAANPPSLLAVDPGRTKCGLAVVSLDGRVLDRAVVPPDQVLDRVRAWVEQYRPQRLLLGDATGARQWRAQFEGLPGMPPVVLVDEGHSSEEARRRYVRAHRRGWRRWVPLGLQVPGEPYDDLVAVILAERYLAGSSNRREK